MKRSSHFPETCICGESDSQSLNVLAKFDPWGRNSGRCDVVTYRRKAYGVSAASWRIVLFVVVCLPRPMEGIGVTPIFRSFHIIASSTTCGWSR